MQISFYRAFNGTCYACDNKAIGNTTDNRGNIVSCCTDHLKGSCYDRLAVIVNDSYRSECYGGRHYDGRDLNGRLRRCECTMRLVAGGESIMIRDLWPKGHKGYFYLYL